MDSKEILRAMQKFSRQEKFVLDVLEAALKQPEANKKDIIDASQIVRDIFADKQGGILYAAKLSPKNKAFAKELEALLAQGDEQDFLQFIERWMGEN